MAPVVVNSKDNPELYKKRVECPECGSLCYWSSFPKRVLRCSGIGCGHVVAKEDGPRSCDMSFKGGIEAPKREVVREDING